MRRGVERVMEWLVEDCEGVEKFFAESKENLEEVWVEGYGWFSGELTKDKGELKGVWCSVMEFVV